MTPEQVEITAPTIEEAIILGVARLSVTRDEVEIEILDEGSRGFLGIGIRDAHVRLTLKPPAPPKEAPAPMPKAQPVSAPPVVEEAPPAPPQEPPAPAEPAPKPPPPPPPSKSQPVKPPAMSGDLDRQAVEQVVLEIATELFQALSVTSELTWKEEKERAVLWLALRGSDANALVGHRAKTLNAVQYLMRSLVRRRLDGPYDLIVDADGYRERRYRSLESLAKKMAERAVRSGQVVRMRPLPTHERRLIHIFLRGDARVKTRSVGTGRQRAVTIIPQSRSG